MKETIRKIVLSLFPELESRLHLPQFAVVTAVSDAPDYDSIADAYRTKYAVNVKLLDEYLNIDETQPEMKAVPLSINGGGMEKGVSIFPTPGTIVEIAFAYGKQSLPFIRSCLPNRLSLPNCDADSVRLQKDYNTYIEADRAGNWTRKTSASIIDDSFNYVLKAINKTETISQESRKIKGSSNEKISGLKKIVAGAFKFLTAGNTHIGSGSNTNITSGNDFNTKTGRNYNEFVLHNKNSTVRGERIDHTIKSHIETILENKTSTVSGNRTNTTTGHTEEISAVHHVVKAPKIHLGSTTENTLKISEDFMQSVILALQVLASHTHPLVDTISQGSSVNSYANEVIAEKARLTPIIKT